MLPSVPHDRQQNIYCHTYSQILNKNISGTETLSQKRITKLQNMKKDNDLVNELKLTLRLYKTKKNIRLINQQGINTKGKQVNWRRHYVISKMNHSLLIKGYARRTYEI